MDLVATSYNERGEPVRTERVHVTETRIELLQVTHLRLGLEVTWISGTGKRIDYVMVNPPHGDRR